MGSPWFSHVRKTQKHILSSSGSLVPGLFFLEASNPGGSLVWRHRVLPPPSVCWCAVPTLSFPPQLTNTNLRSGPFSFWRLSLWLKHCLIWRPGWLRGLNSEREWICVLVWVWGSQPSSFSSPQSLFLTSPVVCLLYGCLSCIMWPGSVAPLHFPSWQKGNIVTEGAGAGLCYVAG